MNSIFIRVMACFLIKENKVSVSMKDKFLTWNLNPGKQKIANLYLMYSCNRDPYLSGLDFQCYTFSIIKKIFVLGYCTQYVNS